MELPLESTVRGVWLDKTKLTSGTLIKIVSEAKLETGQLGEQLVAKVLVKGDTEPKNCAINRPSRKALLEVYGKDTNDWVNKVVTAHLERTMIGGKRNLALYLVPEGYEVMEDEGNYLVVSPIGVSKPEAESEGTVEYPDEEIKPEDIPF